MKSHSDYSWVLNLLFLNNVALFNVLMYIDTCKIRECTSFASLMPPTGESCRLPVLRVLVVRIPRALVLQAGVMVTGGGGGGGGGVTAVLVDLIQAPDTNERCAALMAVSSAI